MPVNDIVPSPSSLASNKAAASIQDKAKSSFTQTPTVIPTPGNGSTNTKPSTTRAEDEDPDYVWDVFFHRPGALQDYSSVGNVGTLYVEIAHHVSFWVGLIMGFFLSFFLFFFCPGLAFLPLLAIPTSPTLIQSPKMRQTKTRTVHFLRIFLRSS